MHSTKQSNQVEHQVRTTSNQTTLKLSVFTKKVANQIATITDQSLYLKLPAKYSKKLYSINYHIIYLRIIILSLTSNGVFEQARWSTALDKGKIIACVFIDFKKAFDVVPHNMLVEFLVISTIFSNLTCPIKSSLQL